MATTPLRRAAAPAAQYVPFLRLTDYSAGGIIPDGVYLIPDFSVVMFQPVKKDGVIAGPMRLSVRVTFDPPNGATSQEERREQHYSMGTKAHLSFQPDPASGKRLLPVENATGGQLYELSNWHMFISSLYQAGMPENYAVDDLSALDGIVVHIKGVPEPESRKDLQTQNTGEVAPAERKPQKIPVVIEVLAAPWLVPAAVTNGIPLAARPVAPAPVAPPAPLGRPALPVRAAAPVQATLPLAPVAAGPPAPPVAAAPAATPVDNEEAVAGAILNVIAQNPNGLNKLTLQTSVFRLRASNTNRQTIMTVYFSDDANLGGLLNQMGYQLTATKDILAL